MENKEKTPRKNARTKKKDPARDFEMLIENFKEKQPVHYSMSGSFKADDVIDHNTFGIGIVISTSDKKMDVVFADQSRILVYER